MSLRSKLFRGFVVALFVFVLFKQNVGWMGWFFNLNINKHVEAILIHGHFDLFKGALSSGSIQISMQVLDIILQIS